MSIRPTKARMTRNPQIAPTATSIKTYFLKTHQAMRTARAITPKIRPFVSMSYPQNVKKIKTAKKKVTLKANRNCAILSTQRISPSISSRKWNR